MLLCLPNINSPDLPLTKKLRTEGWIGIIILCAGGACFNMTVTFGGTVFPLTVGPRLRSGS